MKKTPGFSLIELTIYSSLVLLMMAIIIPMYLACRRYFEISRASVGVQQAANLATYRLNLELMESSPASAEFYPRPSDPSAPVGVVFLSARGNDRQFTIDPSTGTPSWQRVVGYYLDTDPMYPNNPQVQALYRAELVPNGFPRSDGVAPSTLSPRVTTATIRSTGINRRLIAHDVLAPAATGDHGGFEIFASGQNPWTTPGFVPNYASSGPRVYLRLRMFNNTSGVASVSTRRAVNQVETRSSIFIRG